MNGTRYNTEPHTAVAAKKRFYVIKMTYFALLRIPRNGWGYLLTTVVSKDLIATQDLAEFATSAFFSLAALEGLDQ
jgi:hypothetical protein